MNHDSQQAIRVQICNHDLQIHVSYVKRETFGCIVQNMIECLIASPEDRDFYVTACKILSGSRITRKVG